jgi:pyruvate formate-lyase/glycerol dehydratase family glycyl radical enzyme
MDMVQSGLEGLKSMQFERVKKIKEEIVSVTPAICVHRARLVTEAYSDCEAEPVVTKRARAVDRILRRMPIYLEDGQLLAGNQASRPRSAPIFPEYSVSWLEEELETLASRSGDRFESTAEDRVHLKSIIQYWKGKTLQDRAKSLQPQEVLTATAMSVIEWEGNVTAGEGHITVDYATLVQRGLGSYLAEVEAHASTVDLAEPENLMKRKFYEAAILTMKAVSAFIERNAKLTDELAHMEHDGKRRAELGALSQVCAHIASGRPRSFYEALQLVWFVHLILQIESNGHSFSLGRIDQYLHPFYREDLKRGSTSPATALELIECFYLKMFTVNKIRSYSHTLVVSGYPTYQNVCVGGQTTSGEDATNELSYLFLESLAAVKLSEPNFYIRVHENIDERFLLRAAEVVRMGFGMPAFVNDKVIIPSLLNRGVSLEDAMNYATMGCLEVSVPGKWGYRANGKIKFNMLKVFELALNGGKDPLTGLCLNVSERKLGTFETFESLQEEWRRQVTFYTRLHVIADNFNSLATEQLTPDVFCSILVQDCMGRGKLICEGGALYDMQSGSQIGLANVGNALAAMKKVIFEEKRVSQEDLLHALENDFGSADGRRVQDILLSEAPKYGNDDDYVDLLTKDAYDIYCVEVEQYKNTRYGRGPKGGNWFPATVTISSNIPAGKKVGATPDGRKAFTPTADGCSPSHNTETKGPTAVIRSVDKLSTLLITGGNLLNCRLIPSTIRGEDGLRRLVALIRTHFRLYGWHVQFNTIDTEILRDAQKNPENYKDLTVRVAGYSALFVALDKDVQNDIIDRMAYRL